MPERGAHVLPERPLVRIRSRRGWVGLDLRELRAYRGLLYFLTWRDVKVRYKQAALGVAWAVLQPLLTMVLFSVLFGRLAGMPSEGVPYPVFSYAGLLPWMFFANAITNSGHSLIGSASLITKVYFPRVILPASAVAAGLLDLGLALLVFVPLLAYYRVWPGGAILLLPAVVLVTALLALGIGLFTAALNVKYRDVRYALPFVVQVWLFASPVIYPSSLVPERWRWVLALNPLTGIIETFRAALLGRPVPWTAFTYSTLLSLLVLVSAAFFFRRLEKQFADVI